MSGAGVATAAWIASTAALADGVTIYGTLDAAVAHSNNGRGTYIDGTGSWVAGNNIGFKGSEDLGHGMKASFQLEAGIGLNNGAVVSGGYGSNAASSNGYLSPLFSRIATVGLSGDFGSVNIGQQLSPFIATNASGTAGVASFFVNRMLMAGFGAAAVNVRSTTTGFGYDGFFIPNSVLYTSPSFNGWTLNAMTTTKAGSQDGAISGPLDTDSYQAYSLAGSVGPAAVNAAYQTRKNVNSGYSLSASLPLTSDLTLSGSYISNDESASSGSGISTGTKIGSTSVSFAYKVSDALSTNLQYARNDAATEATLTSLGAQYALSKRTFVYATYGRGTGGVNAAFADRGINFYNGGALSQSTSSTNYAFGVATSF